MTDKAYVFTKLYLISIALLDYMGLGIVVTIFPKLLLDPNFHLLPNEWVHGSRIIILGFFLGIYPLGQFIGAVIFGKLSDNLGRKNILTVTLLGTFIGFLLSAVSISIGSGLLLFLSRLLTGLSAGNVAVAQASLIDISTAETKGKNISLLQVILGVAWIVGPPLGGWFSQSSVISWFNYSTPFWLLASLFLILILLTLFAFHETLKQRNKTAINILEDLQQLRWAFSNRHLTMALISWALFVCGWWLFEAFLPTYLQQNLHYQPAEIGDFLASMGATYTVAQIFVMRNMHKFNPKWMVKGSLFISGLSVVLLAFIQNYFLLHAVISFYVVSMAFAIPGLITTISNLEKGNAQGKIMGLISSIQALSTVSMMMAGGFLVFFSQDVTVICGGVLLIVSWFFYFNYFKSEKYSTS